MQFNSRRLDAEAKKRGLSATKLIDEVILSKVKPPTETEAQTFYEQNKERIKAAFSDVKRDLTAYLLQQRQRDEAGRFARHLRETAQARILAPNPTLPKSPAERARVLYAALVQCDPEDENRIGITTTPGLIINGRRVSDQSCEALQAAIEAALNEVNGTTQ